MTRLPILKPKETVSALRKAGFEEFRQVGSHLILGNRTTRKIVTIPMHSGDLKRGVLASIIKQSGLSREEFLQLV